MSAFEKENSYVHESLPLAEHLEILNEGLHDLIEDLGAFGNLDPKVIPNLKALLDLFIQNPNQQIVESLAVEIADLLADDNFQGVVDSFTIRATQQQLSSLQSIDGKLASQK